MHIIERLQQAIETARQQGLGVREEWLGGGGGGDCELRGNRWIFLDLADSPGEQLQQVHAALARFSAGVGSNSLAPALQSPRRKAG